MSHLPCMEPRQRPWSQNKSAMGMITVLLCVTAALLTVTQGCSVGKEFITAFLTNYEPSHYGQSLQLAISSQGMPATVLVRHSSPPILTTVMLGAKETKWVTLPGDLELQPPAFSLKVVNVTSNADVSLVSFNSRFATGDSTVVLPYHQLGVEHWVYTPDTGPAAMLKQLAVVNGPLPNVITLRPASTLTIKGFGTWTAGRDITVTLPPFQTYMVQSDTSLTGMQVKSQRPVAVLAGHQCSAMEGGCDHVYEQLLPLELLSTSYLVPPMHHSGPSLDQAHILATEDGTVVTVIRGKSTTSQNLKAGQTFFELVSFESPVLIQSNKKVMVMYYSNNKPDDPFMTSILPLSKPASEWSVDTPAEYTSNAVILSQRDGVKSVNVYGKKTKSYQTLWNSFQPDDKYMWSIVSLGNDQDHITIKGDSILAVYVHGGKFYQGFASTGVCSTAPVPPPPPPDPCDKIKCREKEECKKGVCVHTSKETCQAVGDPHYQTFDGRRFDFQGTCTYTMVTVIDKTQSLAPFTVTTKNDHRGSLRVAYVRTVNITVHGQTVVIGSQKAMVQVNGELVYLPISLAGGKLTVVSSGGYAVLTTDFGLEVRYNWYMHLYITVPSSYFRLLGGLCGNYNGNRDDDLVSPSEIVLSSVLEFAKSWKIDDKDRFCNDDCKGTCASCSPENQVRYRDKEFCGILTQTNGPFSSCHQTLEPNMFLDNCVFDVCINQGAKTFLCENLKTYNDACLAKGVKVSAQWRMTASCPLQCPANSHYEACSSACPASCIEPEAPAKCQLPCVEGCPCNSGFVLSGENCVPSTSCGCQYQGRYYPSASTFWADNQCSKRCRCVLGKADAQCESTSCRKSEECALRNGVRDCYPTTFGTCQAQGDPHYLTFDGKRFDFQGTCTYVLSKLVGGGGVGTLPVPFEVQVRNENRGRNKAVAYTKTVSITVLNHTLIMSSDSPGKVVIQGRYANLPFVAEAGLLTMQRIGYNGVLRTGFGLTLKFDWRSLVTITLPSTYSGLLAGLCGNFNSQPGDDFLKPDRSTAPNPSAFGLSWQVGGDPGCTNDTPGGQTPKCDPAQKQKYQSGVYCGLIADKMGPFKQCHAKVDPQGHLEDCVFDLCVYGGHASALCDALTSYTTACQEVQATVEAWRSDKLCPSSCPANSHYELCAPGCPQTCSQMKVEVACVSTQCSEGCICDSGFLHSDSKCVPVAECGCVYQGQYYTSGQVFFPGTGGSCSPRCVCTDSTEVVCDSAFTCGANEQCALKDGVQACIAKKIGFCQVGGVREYKSFDGLSFSVYGDCVYKLAEVENVKGGMTPFSVLVQQQTDKAGVTRRVEIETYIYKIVLVPGLVWEVVVNEIKTHLPLTLGTGKVSVSQSGVSIVVVTDFGLKVVYDTVGGVILLLPSTYRDIPFGLCGNYNDKLDDDFKFPNNTLAPSVEAFTAGWAMSETGGECPTGCDGSVCPNPEPQKKSESEKACDIIRARPGPMAECHAVVPPTGYYEACVKEFALPDGGQAVLCRHIQMYVSLCQSAGAKVANWRSGTFCPLQCPAKSHYELCSDTCSSTCATLSAPTRCPPCQEGCQCDEGLVFDGGECVALDTCGCVEKGKYYKSGQSMMMEECMEQCSCQAGQFTCQANHCDTGKECRIRGGVLGCYLIDPCVEMKCREQERCVVVKKEAVCVAQSKALCWVFGDPHYTTFDGSPFSFQGTSSYTLVNTTRRDPTLTDFTILTKNELRGNSVGSFMRTTTLDLLGHRMTILTGQKGSVEVDGVRKNLPIVLESGKINITGTVLKGTIQSSVGLEVSFDWNTLVMVTVTSSYFNNLEGQCGSYNGDPNDDFTMPSGVLTTNVTMWASSWTV